MKIFFGKVEELTTNFSELETDDYILSFDIYVMFETFSSSKFFKDSIVLHSPGVPLSVRGRRSGGVMLTARKHI